VRDGLQAFWLVFRFNLFCRLSASFRQIPQIERIRLSQATLDTRLAMSTRMTAHTKRRAKDSDA
jgi:hypothetical protein